MDQLTNQYFNYRETPVNYDGTGTLVDIKGNTSVWNQLVQNGNFVNNSNWTKGSSSATLVIANNKATITAVNGGYNNDLRQNIDFTVGHKYFIRFNYLMSSEYSGRPLRLNEVATEIYFASFPYSSTLTQAKAIFTVTESPNAQPKRLLATGNIPTGAVFEISNFIIIDLTQMFGSSNEPATVSDFETWLSNNIGLLPYYDYTQGKLLPFKGESLKTTGKNLLPFSLASIKSANTSGTWNDNTYTLNSISFEVQTDGDKVTGIVVNGTPSTNTNLNLTDKIDNIFEDGMILNGCPSGGGANTYGLTALFSDNGNKWVEDLGSGATVTSANTKPKVRVYIVTRSGVQFNNLTFYPMIRFGDVQDATFVPYETSTLSLPISTYFPTGMKSAGDKYDELTESKAITRIEHIVIDETWEITKDSPSWQTSGLNTYYVTLSVLSKRQPNNIVPNIVCNRLKTVSYSTLKNGQEYNTVCNTGSNGSYISFLLDFADVASVKTWLASNPLEIDYELATYTETAIDPPLDLTYDMWDDGTEQILPENTSVPITTPILCDIDYRTMIPVNADDDPDGSGVITGTGNYRYHSMATLTATPTDEIYRFLRWEDENGDTVSTNSTYTFEVGE